jgi:CBS domain-containing membrane protein
MLVIGALSIAVSQPLLFPAIGASTFIVFFAPRTSLAAPRNLVLGHTLGAALGAAAAWLFGVEAHAAWLAGDGAWAAVGAASLALACTSASMATLDLPHPPAGATTLIVATGLMGGLADLAAIVVSALALVGLAHLAHRLTGEPYPRWRSRPERISELPADGSGAPASHLPPG